MATWRSLYSRGTRISGRIIKSPKKYFMVALISEGIHIQVETFYQKDYSNPLQYEFMFAYRITIKNTNPFSIKLHSRYWNIFDSCDPNSNRKIEGEGVVGMQPVITAGEEYRYVSGCNLHSEMGQMFGHYIMENLQTKEKFQAQIPLFEMIAPFKYN